MYKRAFILVLLIIAFGTNAYSVDGMSSIFVCEWNDPVDMTPTGASTLDNVIYVATHKGLFAYMHGDEPKKIMDLYQEVFNDFGSATVVLGMPFTYRGELMLVNIGDGIIKCVKDGRAIDTEPMMRLPKSDNCYSYDLVYHNIIEFEGNLYALVNKTMEESRSELWRIYPETGKYEVLNNKENFIEVCGYQSGKLLALTATKQSAMPLSNIGYSLAIIEADNGQRVSDYYDVKSHSVHDQADILGIMYDQEAQEMYYACENKLYRASSLEAEPVVIDYYPQILDSTCAPSFFLNNEEYVLPTTQGIFLSAVNRDLPEKQLLRISGERVSGVASAFMRFNPNIALDFEMTNRLEEGSAAHIASSIASGDSSVDIYVIHGIAPLRSLIEKGYAKDLSDSSKLMAAVERMYPTLKNAVMVDGKLFAFPSEVRASLWQYNNELFDKLNIQQPESFMDYVKLINDWYDLFSSDPTMSLVDIPIRDIKKRTYYTAIMLYISETVSLFEPAVFNTPELKKILLEIDKFPDDIWNGQREHAYDPQTSMPLIHQFFDLAENKMWTDYCIDLPPSIIEGQSSKMRATLSAFVINPNSNNLNAALKFLEFVSENAAATSLVTMYPDYQTPVKDVNIELQIEQLLRQIDEAKDYVVPDSMKQEFELEISNTKRNIEYLQKRIYVVSPDTIQIYHTLANDMQISIVDSLFSSQEIVQIITDLIERHLQGQISLDTMLQELDRKMMMVYLEQQ